MLTIPDSLNLKRNKKAERFLLEKSREWLDSSERSPGIHATDLLSPRKAYWREVKPLPLTDRQVTIFLIGRVLHAFVLSAVDEIPLSWETDGGSKYCVDLDISYSPDKILSGEIKEFKTARNFNAPDTISDLWGYVEQLLIYMVAENKLTSTLWILYINLRDKETKRTSPEFRAYRIKISQEDLERTRAELLQIRLALAGAIEIQDHTILPLCAEYMCGDGNCGWWDDCKPEGRYDK